MSKKKDLFLKKFEQKIKSYQKRRESEFIRGMKTIGEIIGNSIANRDYGLSNKTETKFLDALEICKEYELDCDAIHNLEKYVFNGNNSSINTTDCPKRENFKMEIGNFLSSLPKRRGYIYIAWRATPLNVYYIGMTEKFGVYRLDLRQHGNLSCAIERGATQFTIIFPDNSNNIKSVEGSFIRIVNELQDKKIVNKLRPELLNEKNESFNNFNGEIDELEKSLKRFIGKVKAGLRS